MTNEELDALVAGLREWGRLPLVTGDRPWQVLCRDAADAIYSLRADLARAEAERDEWKRKYGDANEWGLREAAAWKTAYERAEAERDNIKRGYADMLIQRNEAEAERDALRQALDQIETLAAHDTTGCPICTAVVSAAVNAARQPWPSPPTSLREPT